MFHRTSKGFTLIELLIVVAIIAILAAIAVPNFLEAQTRAKISRVKNDLRVICVAVESYQIDNNNTPLHTPVDQGWGSAWYQWVEGLNTLSTPIAYISSVAMHDPFTPDKMAGWYPKPTVYSYFWADYGDKNPPNISWFRMCGGEKGHSGYMVSSWGPDRRTSSAEWTFVWPKTADADGATLTINRSNPRIDCWYDSTNGTLSAGDIARWGGEFGIATP
jgi:prepilin-type N-terminal cleavage/methylation domain-containing protein